MAAKAFTLGDKIALGRAFSAFMRAIPTDSTESLGAWLRRHKQTEGALNRFWRLVIASALNANRLDRCALCRKGDPGAVLNSAEAGSMGMSRVPLSRLYDSVAPFLEERGGSVRLNTHVEGAAWDAATAQWTIRTRAGELTSDFVVVRCRLKRPRSCCRICLRPKEQRDWRSRLTSTSIGPFAACICGLTARLPIWNMPCCWIARFTGCITSRGSKPGAAVIISSWW